MASRQCRVVCLPFREPHQLGGLFFLHNPDVHLFFRASSQVSRAGMMWASIRIRLESGIFQELSCGYLP
jgi:hypothetical protein